jgi:membrane-bound lytic murein transglycosylase B
MFKIAFSLLLLVITTFTPVVYAYSNFAERPDVQAFIQHMVKKYHFKQAQLETLFSEVKVRPQVVQQIKKPAESEAWYIYQKIFITESRIQQGVDFWQKHEAALRKAEKTYGIPASIIVATIGVESKYGEKIGAHRVIDALTNLAFSESRRANFFRKELEQFLLLTREEDLDPTKIMGSYAGAIGQPQFMPSSYRHYAVDFSNSGKTDLMYDQVDVIGSIANYYNKNGWKQYWPVAMPAKIIGSRFQYLTRTGRIKQPLTVGELSEYGVVSKYKINDDHLKVKVLELENRYNAEYWLTFHNFNVIKRYNASNLYAMAVFQLSSYIDYAYKQRKGNG